MSCNVSEVLPLMVEAGKLSESRDQLSPRCYAQCQAVQETTTSNIHRQNQRQCSDSRRGVQTAKLTAARAPRAPPNGWPDSFSPRQHPTRVLSSRRGVSLRFVLQYTCGASKSKVVVRGNISPLRQCDILKTKTHSSSGFGIYSLQVGSKVDRSCD